MAQSDFAGDTAQPLPESGAEWKCALCATSKTPMKRNHPQHGPKSLCNACGVRLSRRVKSERRAGGARGDRSCHGTRQKSSRDGSDGTVPSKRPCTSAADAAAPSLGLSPFHATGMRRPLPRSSLPHEDLQLPGKAMLTVRTPRGTDVASAAVDCTASGLDALDRQWLASFNAGSESPAHSNAHSTDPSTASATSTALFISPGSPLAASLPAAANAAPLQPLTADTLAAALAVLAAIPPSACPDRTGSFAHAEQCLCSAALPSAVPVATARAIAQHWHSKRVAGSQASSGQVAGAAGMLRHCASSSMLRTGVTVEACAQPSGVHDQGSALLAAPTTAAFSCPVLPAIGCHTMPSLSACEESLLGASLVLPSNATDSAGRSEELQFAHEQFTPKADALGSAAAAHAAERSPDASAASHGSDASADSVTALPPAAGASAATPAPAGLTFIVTDEPVADRWARVRERLVQASPTSAALAASPRTSPVQRAPAAAHGPSMFEDNALMTPQAAPNALLALDAGSVLPSRSTRALAF